MGLLGYSSPPDADADDLPLLQPVCLVVETGPATAIASGHGMVGGSMALEDCQPATCPHPHCRAGTPSASPWTGSNASPPPLAPCPSAWTTQELAACSARPQQAPSLSVPLSSARGWWTGGSARSPSCPGGTTGPTASGCRGWRRVRCLMAAGRSARPSSPMCPPSPQRTHPSASQ